MVQRTPTRDMRVSVNAQARAHVNQHQPLVDATSRLLKRMSVRHHVESDAFDVDTEVLVDVLIERGDLRDAS